MKKRSKTIIVSIVILGVLLLITSILLFFLYGTSSSSSKGIIPLGVLNNYNDNSGLGESALSVSSTANYDSSFINHGGHGREITEPITSAPINPGIVGPAVPVTPQPNTAPINPGVIRSPVTPRPNYAPISPRTIRSPVIPTSAPVETVGLD